MPEGALQRVSQTLALPYRRVCLLKVRTGGTEKPMLGTGWFFGSRLVITADHVVNNAVGKAAISIWPARHDETDKPFGVWNSVDILHGASGDFAGVVLDEPVGSRVGTFGIADLEAIASSGRVVVAGYNENDSGTSQYLGEGQISGLDGSGFTYDILTAAGQSGGPVWKAGASDLVAGIHIRDGQAVLITDTVLGELLGWRGE